MFDKMGDHLVQARGVHLIFAIGRVEEDGDGLVAGGLERADPAIDVRQLDLRGLRSAEWRCCE